MGTNIEFTELGEPFVQIPNSLLRDGTLTPGAKVVYAILRSYAGGNPDQMAWPSQATLAVQSGLSEKTIRKYIEELEGRNLITPMRFGVQQSNRYEVHHPSEKTTVAPDVNFDLKTFSAALHKKPVSDKRISEDVLRCLIKGGNKAALKALISYLSSVNQDEATQYLQSKGMPYRLSRPLLTHVGFPLITIRRATMIDWLKKTESTKSGITYIADYLYSFTEKDLQSIVLPEFTDTEIREMRARYKPHLSPL